MFILKKESAGDKKHAKCAKFFNMVAYLIEHIVNVTEAEPFDYL